MKLKGKVHKFGDNVDTDSIIPARYLDTTDSKELALHCMEGIDEEFSRKVKRGDIIVAGKNFGCGSSREHASLSIKGCGVSVVVAESFSGIFFRNSINIGLAFLECKDARKIKKGDLLEINLNAGMIKDFTTGRSYTTTPFPNFLREIIRYGGLLKWLKKKNLTQKKRR